MIKQQFNGEFISFSLRLPETSITTATAAHIFDLNNKLGSRKMPLKL
jgi:hypothetical protein